METRHLRYFAAVARELARVTRPGGRLGLASWTEDSGIGDIFRVMKPFQAAPPPQGVVQLAVSPWGLGWMTATPVEHAVLLERLIVELCARGAGRPGAGGARRY